MVSIVEHERSRLVDRRNAGACGRIWLRAGMHREGRKAGKTIVHSKFLLCLASNRANADGSGLRRQGDSMFRLHFEYLVCSLPSWRNDSFAIDSINFALVLRGAVRGGGLASADARALQRKPHPLGRYWRAL